MAGRLRTEPSCLPSGRPPTMWTPTPTPTTTPSTTTATTPPHLLPVPVQWPVATVSLPVPLQWPRTGSPTPPLLGTVSLPVPGRNSLGGQVWPLPAQNPAVMWPPTVQRPPTVVRSVPAQYPHGVQVFRNPAQDPLGGSLQTVVWPLPAQNPPAQNLPGGPLRMHPMLGPPAGLRVSLGPQLLAPTPLELPVSTRGVMASRFGGQQESDLLEKLGEKHRGSQMCDEETSAVQLVSLGSYCGPKLSFQKMGRGAETLPFDWIRSRMEGILHFLRTDFRGFFEFVTEMKVPSAHQMVMFRGYHHSFWHDDPRDASMHERYTRRIARFWSLDA
ncbi:unnamed protein product, partial [Polarella glacialis]